jgi:sugar/nucleoside kinase (ribokinase family)
MGAFLMRAIPKVQTPPQTLQFNDRSPFRRLVGVGGIGTGLFFALEGDHTLGRNESRPARLLDIRDYCKLHIISHYVAVLLGARESGQPFHVVPIAKVGGDDVGHRLIGELASVGIDTEYVETIQNQPTLLSVCFQYADGSGGNITASNSAASLLTCSDVDLGAELLADSGPRAMALAAPEVPFEARRRLLELATNCRAFRVAALASAEIERAHSEDLFSLVDLLAINQHEAEILSGHAFDPGNPNPFLSGCVDSLKAEQTHIQIILTVGKHGTYAFAEGVWDYRPALNVPVVSTAGAGDALLAGVLAALAVGMPFVRPRSQAALRSSRSLESALDLGVLLAAYSIVSPHTIHPDADLDRLLWFGQSLGVEVPAGLAHFFGPRPPASAQAESDGDIIGRHGEVKPVPSPTERRLVKGSGS